MRQILNDYGLFIIAVILIYASPVFGGNQIYSPERPGNSFDDPIQNPKDLSGRATKCPRVRTIHSQDPVEEGASAYLTQVDPWLGYQRGRELFLREFSKDDGVFGESGRMAGPTLEDQTTKIMTRDHAASCMFCHNVPFRDAGAGATMFKNGGMGRNTPHLYGVGLIEMLGWQTRLKLLELGDRNRNGFIDKKESENIAAIIISDDEDNKQKKIDFGCFGDKDNDGKPDLNSVCFIWYVDKNGKRISWARSLKDEGVAGYNFEVQVLGWGHGRASLSSRIPITSTIRSFSAQAFDNHSGMQAFDPTMNEEPGFDGLALASLAGAQQFYTGRTRDRGQVKDKSGISLDDPDRDGVIEEITEGDLDLIEFYQLNHPQPAQTAHTPREIQGRSLMSTIGCTSCHTPSWKIEADNRGDSDYTKRYPGDRRFFDLVLSFNPKSNQLEGRIENKSIARPDVLVSAAKSVKVPRRNSYRVKDIYSDFLHHDLGPNFHQVQFDGSVIKAFKTAPLWGVGSSAPYGHDGASLTLDSVIRRHGGEAEKEALTYSHLNEDERLAIQEYLRSLTLYPVDDLPCDLDGDGKISKHFVVAGVDTGVERLNPEWLFLHPGKIEGEIASPDGSKIQSFSLLNFKEAYGINLDCLKSSRKYGFPDKRLRRKERQLLTEY